MHILFIVLLNEYFGISWRSMESSGFVVVHYRKLLYLANTIFVTSCICIVSIISIKSKTKLMVQDVLRVVGSHLLNLIFFVTFILRCGLLLFNFQLLLPVWINFLWQWRILYQFCATIVTLSASIIYEI